MKFVYKNPKSQYRRMPYEAREREWTYRRNYEEAKNEKLDSHSIFGKICMFFSEFPNVKITWGHP